MVQASRLPKGFQTHLPNSLTGQALRKKGLAMETKGTEAFGLDCAEPAWILKGGNSLNSAKSLVQRPSTLLSEVSPSIGVQLNEWATLFQASVTCVF